MKTNKLFLFAAAALCLAACSEKMEQPIESIDNSEQEEVNPVSNPDSRSFVVTAEVPVVSRTVLNNDYTVSWQDTDEISIFAGSVNNRFTFSSVDGTGKATFTGTADGSEFYALYPYDSEASISAGVITLSLPSSQTGVAGTFGPGLNKSVAYTDNGELSMRNIFGLIQFAITRSDITSVTISSAGHEFMTGKVEITLDGSGIPSCSVVNGTRYVTLYPSSSTFAPGTYYAVVLPQTYHGGLVFTFTTASQAGVRRKTADAAVARSHILAAGSPETSLNLNDIISLGSTETANCYVAGEAGRRYKMPVTAMGNGYTTAEDTGYSTTLQGASPGITPSSLAPQSAQLLWQTAADLVKDVTYDNGYVYFTLNGSVGGALTPGNASIAVYSDEHNSGDILWSWHIWVTDVNLDALAQTWTIHDDYAVYSNYEDPILMDRNLGALSNQPWGTTNSHAAHGLMYQWGRKDPFPGANDDSINSTTPITTYDAANNVIASTTTTSLGSYTGAVGWGYVAGAIVDRDADVAKYPMNFSRIGSGQFLLPDGIKAYHDLWGLPIYTADSDYVGHKTIYDPCPPGYRVPNPYFASGVVPGNKNGGNINKTYTTYYITNYNTSKTDGGYWVQYDRTNTTWVPYTGQIKNDTGALYRVGNYGGYYWCSRPSSTSSYKGAALTMDYNNFYSVYENSLMCFGFAVRCEKIK